MPESARLQYRQCAQTRRRRRLTGKPLTPRTTGAGAFLCAVEGLPLRKTSKCPVSVQQTAQQKKYGTWVGGIVPQSRLRVFIVVRSCVTPQSNSVAFRRCREASRRRFPRGLPYRPPKDTRCMFPARFIQVKVGKGRIFSSHDPFSRHGACGPPVSNHPITSLFQKLSAERLKPAAFAHTIRVR